MQFQEFFLGDKRVSTLWDGCIYYKCLRLIFSMKRQSFYQFSATFVAIKFFHSLTKLSNTSLDSLDIINKFHNDTHNQNYDKTYLNIKNVSYFWALTGQDSKPRRNRQSKIISNSQNGDNLSRLCLCLILEQNQCFLAPSIQHGAIYQLVLPVHCYESADHLKPVSACFESIWRCL